MFLLLLPSILVFYTLTVILPARVVRIVSCLVSRVLLGTFIIIIDIRLTFNIVYVMYTYKYIQGQREREREQERGGNVFFILFVVSGSTVSVECTPNIANCFHRSSLDGATASNIHA